MLRLAIGFAVFSFVAADIIKYKDCGSKSGTVKTVDITPCPSEPCALHRNSNVTFNINFTANTKITKAKTFVYGYIAGVKVPFPVPPDACLNMPCPVTPGADVTYTNAVFVKPIYPLVTLVAQWEVRDQNDDKIICINVPAEIVNS